MGTRRVNASLLKQGFRDRNACPHRHFTSFRVLHLSITIRADKMITSSESEALHKRSDKTPVKSLELRSCTFRLSRIQLQKVVGKTVYFLSGGYQVHKSSPTDPHFRLRRPLVNKEACLTQLKMPILHHAMRKVVGSPRHGNIFSSLFKLNNLYRERRIYLAY